MCVWMFREVFSLPLRKPDSAVEVLDSESLHSLQGWRSLSLRFSPPGGLTKFTSGR